MRLHLDEFIQSAAERLPAPEDHVRRATADLLRALKVRISRETFHRLLFALPGTFDFLGKTGKGDDSMNDRNRAAGQPATESDHDRPVPRTADGRLHPDHTSVLVRMFFRFLQGRGHEDLAVRILREAPELAALADLRHLAAGEGDEERNGAPDRPWIS